VAPHAPLLLPEVAGPANAARTEAVAAAVASIDLADADVVVVVSPHGRTTGVYARALGDLGAFGPRGIDVSRATDAGFAAALAEAWRRPVLDEPADHGIVVPLRLLPAAAPVVAVAFEEGAPAGLARDLASALETVAGDRTVAFVASANLSAGLRERAPVPSLDGAAAVDDRVLRALQLDPGALTEQGGELARAGSCAAAPLAAFGTLFAGRTCEVLAYDHPFGVGYPVAVTR
jgi:hypothetical protein